MFKYFTILSAIVVLKCNSECSVYIDGKTQCNTLQDLKYTGVQDSWEHMYVKKNKSVPEIITYHTFKQYQNVKKIVIENSVIDIEANSFAYLHSLRNIELKNCSFPIVKENWFSFLPIENLTIGNSQVTSFETNCFLNSGNLKLVRITNNNIIIIHADVFSGTFIETLRLDNNKIQVIRENAFSKMPQLKELTLRANLLTSFNAKLIMGTEVSSLYILDLSENKIQNITENNFSIFPNISGISLASNEVTWIEDGAFNGLDTLEMLDVSENQLKSFPERAIPLSGLPSIISLFLQRNHLNYLPRSFVRYFPKLRFINIFDNPWQCACYQEIRSLLKYYDVKILCAGEYLDGTRPVCVVPETSPDKCVDNARITDDLYESFNQTSNRMENNRCMTSYLLEYHKILELFYSGRLLPLTSLRKSDHFNYFPYFRIVHSPKS